MSDEYKCACPDCAIGRIDRLEAENAELKRGHGWADRIVEGQRLRAEIDRLSGLVVSQAIRIAQLRAALKPFAEAAGMWKMKHEDGSFVDDDSDRLILTSAIHSEVFDCTVGDLRRAAEAWKGGGDDERRQ